MTTDNNNIETNKTNKKRKMNLTLMICYTQIKVLNVNILLLTLILLSAFNVAIYVAVFTTPFEWDN